jgi:Zn-dependent protease
MAIISLSEIIDMVAMTLFVGFIFSDVIPFRRDDYDPLKHYSRRFDFEGLRIAIMATAPAIILHELAHKFTALSFGMGAVFNAFYRETTYLVLGVFAIFSKLAGLPFVFFVPGFVRISGYGTNLMYALTAFSGPVVNLFLWLASAYLIKNKKYKKRYFLLLLLTKKINMFLFIFNMLPFPGFDGFNVFRHLINAFF